MEQSSQQARTVADAPPTCDRDCTKPAVFAYAWEWGEKGVCCAEHQFLLRQAAEHLGGRTVSFTPLVPAGPAPITRDERIQLNARVLTLEAELEDAKSRGLDLFRENTTLTRQVQAATVRGRELELQLKDHAAKIAELKELGEARDAEHGQLTDELSRLRTLSKFVDQPPPTSPQQRGLTPRG